VNRSNDRNFRSVKSALFAATPIANHKPAIHSLVLPGPKNEHGAVHRGGAFRKSRSSGLSYRNPDVIPGWHWLSRVILRKASIWRNKEPAPMQERPVRVVLIEMVRAGKYMRNSLSTQTSSGPNSVSPHAQVLDAHGIDIEAPIPSPPRNRALSGDVFVSRTVGMIRSSCVQGSDSLSWISFETGSCSQHMTQNTVRSGSVSLTSSRSGARLCRRHSSVAHRFGQWILQRIESHEFNGTVLKSLPFPRSLISSMFRLLQGSATFQLG
jgi:hypothetical protein